MDFNFSEEQTMIRDSLARLLRDQYDFDTRRKVSESDAGWRPEMWQQFAELGLLAAPFSEDDGGLAKKLPPSESRVRVMLFTCATVRFLIYIPLDEYTI